MDALLKIDQKVWYWKWHWNEHDVLEVTVQHGTVKQLTKPEWEFPMYAILPDGAEDTISHYAAVYRRDIYETERETYEGLVKELDNLVWYLQDECDTIIKEMQKRLLSANARTKSVTAAYTHNRDILERLRKEQP